MAKIKSMTSGNPGKLILLFALPLMLGNLFQQFYTIADAAIVGQFLGVNAIAAVGAAEWIVWMIVSVIQGFAQGFSIQMAQDFGAEDFKNLRRVMVNSIFLSILCTALLLVLGLSLSGWILDILHTPEDIYADTAIYLRTMLFGTPVVMAYNLFASILRALGDSKTPLYAMMAASVLNIGLDLLFVITFDMGVFGAAAATLIAQLFSGVICFVKIFRIEALRITKEDVSFSLRLQGKLMKLGLPMAFQNMVISVGGMFVQSVLNGYGVFFIAGFTATNKLYGMLEVAATSYGFAVTTYSGQNLGAGAYERLHRGYRVSLVISLITSVVIAAVMIFFGKWILLCFISGDEQTVSQTLAIAYRFLFIMSACLPILYYLHVTRSFIQGIGNTVLPMVSGFAEFFMRVGAAFLLPRFFGQDGIFFAEVAAWLGADIVLLTSFIYCWKRLDQRKLAGAGQEE